MIVALIFFLIPIPDVSGLQFIPPGLSKKVSTYLEVSGLGLQGMLSGQCARDTGTFLKSLSKASKILETCEEDTCLEELKDDIFALKQFDAAGKLPSGISQWATTSEGSWATCNEIDGEKYETDYCYLTLVPGQSVACPQVEVNPETSVKLKLGICIPTSCSKQDILKIFNSFSPLPLTACNLFCVKSAKTSLGFWFWMFTLFMTFMVSLAAMATTIDYYFVDSEEKGRRFRILCCFSLLTNFKMICTPRKEIPGVHLKGLDFLRFVSVIWVIVGHSPINYMFGDTMKEILNSPNYFWNHLLLDATYAVETFVMITATLLSFALFRNPNYSNAVRSRSFWLKLFLRRYYRIMPALLSFIGFTTFYGPFLRGNRMASMFNNQAYQAEVCKTKWWMNILMIQNFWKPSENCFPISWYTASDFQFFLLSPLIIVPLMKSQRHGLRSSVFLTFMSILATFFTFWYHKLPPFHYTTHRMEEFLVHIHQQVIPRIPIFIMGILLGKSLAVHNKPIAMLKEHAKLCWFLTGIAFFVCFYGRFLAVVPIGEEEMGPLLSAAHYTFHRFLWSFVIIWVIYSCQFDLGSPITSLLSSRIWQPFGRLSYCMFVVHWWMIYFVMNFSDRPLHYTSMQQVIIEVTIPTVVLTLPTALIWSSVFEVPVARMEKLLLAK